LGGACVKVLTSGFPLTGTGVDTTKLIDALNNSFGNGVTTNQAAVAKQAAAALINAYSTFPGTNGGHFKYDVPTLLQRYKDAFTSTGYYLGDSNSLADFSNDLNVWNSQVSCPLG